MAEKLNDSCTPVVTMELFTHCFVIEKKKKKEKKKSKRTLKELAQNELNRRFAQASNMKRNNSAGQGGFQEESKALRDEPTKPLIPRQTNCLSWCQMGERC